MSNQQRKQSTQIHVDYKIQKQEKGNGCTNALTIKTPLWVLIVMHRFSRAEFYDIVKSLRERFSYAEDELVPLELINYDFDFIMITENADTTRDFGVTFTDKDGGIDGHEVEIAEFIAQYYYKSYDRGTTEPGIGQLYSGVESYTQNLEDYMMSSNDISISIRYTDCVYDVIVKLDDIELNFVMYEEVCAPSTTIDAQSVTEEIQGA